MGCYWCTTMVAEVQWRGVGEACPSCSFEWVLGGVRGAAGGTVRGAHSHACDLYSAPGNWLPVIGQLRMAGTAYRDRGIHVYQ